MERKAIFVSTEVHKELKILSANEGLSMNMLVEKLMNFYKANRVEEVPQFKGPWEALNKLKIR